MSVATYLYCIVQGSRKPSVTGVPPGVPEGGPPRLRDLAPSWWLVTADVPLSVYGPGRLEGALSDLDWVGQVALGHERVVEHFARRPSLTVIPMKLFTLFSSDDRAAREIQGQKAHLARVARRIGGAEEWGVRIVRAETAPSAVVDSGRPSTGTAFLAARKQARDAVSSARAAAAVAASTAFERLARIARDTARRDAAPPAGASPPLLDAAFLVPVTSRAKFKSAAQREAKRCATAGVQLTLTGPWPAYNFVAGTRT